MKPFLSSIRNEQDLRERLGRFGLRRDPPDGRRKHAPPLVIAVPPRTDNFCLTGEIIDQGAEGSCAGESGATVLGTLETRLGRVMPHVRMSGRWLYDAAKIRDDSEGLDEQNYHAQSGTTQSGVANIMREWGGVPEADMPYHAGEVLDPTLPELEMLKEVGRKHRIGPYSDLMRGQNAADWPSVIMQIQTCIWQTGCCYVGFAVTYGWLDTGPDGIIHESKVVAGGHAVCLAYYDERYFGFPNSWGMKWGKGGYGFYPYTDIPEHLLGALRLQLR